MKHHDANAPYTTRCKTKPADLPKNATLPSIKSDNLSFLDEEIVSRVSSNSKASHEDSLSGFSNGSKETKNSNTEKYSGDDQEEKHVCARADWSS